MDLLIIGLLVAGALDVYNETKKKLDRRNSDELFNENAWKIGIDPNSREKDGRNGDA